MYGKSYISRILEIKFDNELLENLLSEVDPDLILILFMFNHNTTYLA